MDIQQFILDLGLPPSLIIIIVGALPIFELRGAIPLGINILEMHWALVYFLAVLGNMLPIPFILRLLNRLACNLGRYHFFKRLFEWLFNRTKARSGIIEKYQKIGLALFVAVPLPLTGAWTGAIAAVILGLPFRDAMIYIFLGVMMAGIMITILSLLGWWGAIVAGIALTGLFVVGTFRRNGRS
jgi:uncharacterized membrane protein